MMATVQFRNLMTNPFHGVIQHSVGECPDVPMVDHYARLGKIEILSRDIRKDENRETEELRAKVQQLIEQNATLRGRNGLSALTEARANEPPRAIESDSKAKPAKVS